MATADGLKKDFSQQLYSEAIVSNCKMLISYNYMLPTIDESCQYSDQEVWTTNLNIADTNKLESLKSITKGTASTAVGIRGGI